MTEPPGKNTGEASVKSEPIRFMGWRDYVITPLVFYLTMGLAALPLWQLNRHVKLSLFANTVLYFVVLVAVTMITLKIIRMFFPLKDGIYSYERNPGACYIWNLMGFLCIMTLSFQYQSLLLPPPLRKWFYQLLGAKIGGGIVIVGGKINEPWRVTIEENVIIGDDAGLTPHVLGGDGILVLGSIHIKRGATIGGRSIIMPGVTIGENAVVDLMSVVPMNTKIGPGEVWGGIPAKKIR